MIVTRTDLEASLARVADEVTDPRAGIHGPGSPAWTLGRDAFAFLGAGRAALMQLAHPPVAFAIAEHSRTRDDVVGRFRGTFRNVFAMSFGDLDHAVTAARRVHAIHARVGGRCPVDAGAFRAGAPYHANDVDSLAWVYATLVDTVVAVLETLDGPLGDAGRDAYVRATHPFARLFGIPEARLAPDWQSFARSVAATTASGAVAVTPIARELAGFLLGHGGARPQNAFGRTVELATAALLPPTVRDGYGLRFGAAEQRAFARLVGALRVARAVTPPSLQWMPAYHAARARLAGRPPSPRVAWIEAQLFRLAGLATSS